MIDYLRVSVTDRCNFRCVYCMPEEGVPPTAKNDSLTSDEIVRLVEIAASLGVSKVRLTGGEPLLRNDLTQMVRQIDSRTGMADLSCTTNGFLLATKAAELAAAGLKRVNVSMDTLRPERMQGIARRGDLGSVLSGVDAALREGLEPVKINCVAMKGVNDDEAQDFAAWTTKARIHVRFIELMPIRWNLDELDIPPAHRGAKLELLEIRQASGGMLSDLEMRRRFISAAQIRDSIEAKHGPLDPADIPTNGPARTYRIKGAPGTIGFISQITDDLCRRCNRLRLTHDGFLRPCLMSDGELNLRDPMRRGASDEDLRRLFLDVVRLKPERHYLAEGQKVVGRGMSQIGG